MKNLLPLCTILFAGFAHADGSFNCNDLHGEWIGDNFEYSKESQRTYSVEYGANGEYRITSDYNDGDKRKRLSESGHWECDGEYITVYTNYRNPQDYDYKEIHKILELNMSYSKVSLHEADCETIRDDCLIGMEFEKVRP